MTQTKIFTLIIGLLLLAGVAGALLHKGTGLKFPAPSGQTPIVETQTAGSLASSTAPSLSAQVKFSGDLSPEVKSILTSNIAKLRSALLKDNSSYSGWMNLAIQYKTAGDYDAARKVWEYITYIHPAETIALHNLGDLYYHQFKDYAKAESYFKQAIQADPSRSLNYTALYELYHYSYKQNTSAAVDTLKDGIAHVGGNQVIDLSVALASYYQEKNDTVNAVSYYTKARDAAQKAGNTALVAQINASLAALKQ